MRQRDLSLSSPKPTDPGRPGSKRDNPGQAGPLPRPLHQPRFAGARAGPLSSQTDDQQQSPSLRPAAS